MIELLKSMCVFCNNRNINYLVTTFKFKTAKECGHQICSTCLEGSIFRNKKSTECPKCKAVIKKSQLSDKTKEQLAYERESKIRKEVMSKFNLIQEDFETKEEFYKYQELAEEIVMNKLNGTNLEWAEKQIAKNWQENQAKIGRRTAIKAEEMRRFKEELIADRERRKEELREIIIREREELLARQLEREEGMQVILGERKLTTAEMKKLKEKEEKEAREKDAIQQGYGPQIVRYDNNAVLWPQHQLDAQPRKEKVLVEVKKESLSAEEERAARRVAGGLDPTAAATKTTELMFADLLI
uniref:RING-type domain-containing protein n=1 Tax=Mucochytrium quahogii TaxID=96639 RepID=A0A7S2S831_9STRA|mmetsp:Transcript_38151/g.61920  ORF Transcript_38151/g.61920 Transcript_38151/m.61920 type:complete len:299 (+) Transcript_38151:3-899(+)